jgi:hypothetical protein
MTVQVAKRGPLRCSYCFSDVMVGLLMACTCGATYHAECAQGLQKCASCPETSGFENRQMAAITPIVIDGLFKRITGDQQWNEIHDVAKSNARGKIWLTGGKVYRTLAEILFNVPVHANTCDHDFVTAASTWFKHTPSQWMVKINGDYGSDYHDPWTMLTSDHVWRFSRSSRHVFDLMTFKRVTQVGFPATLDGYFQSVPLDVQAVALDLEERQLLGPGLRAICRKTIGVNNAVEVKSAAKKASISPQQFLEARSLSLGFTPSNVSVFEKVGSDRPASLRK